MGGKEIKVKTRIKCPLCGALAWQSSFEKEKKPLLKIFSQWSPGFRQIKYMENIQPDILQNLHLFFVERIEELYKKLTGIDIQQLIIEKGGEKERQKSKLPSTATVSITGWMKAENLWSKKNQHVTETGYPQKILIKNLMK